MITNEQLGFLNNQNSMKLMDSIIPNDFSLILLDIDHFKQLNDEYGHTEGDEMISLVAQAISKIAEPLGGTGFRGYGDEFGLILPETALEEAFLSADEIRKLIITMVEEGDFQWRSTVSMGVAQYPRDGKEKESIIRAASAALYTAKENGRNRVALPPNEDMVLKSCYYPAAALNRLKQIALSSGKKESVLFREALEGLLRRYDDSPEGV